jgi:hypothetical protein
MASLEEVFIIVRLHSQTKVVPGQKVAFEEIINKIKTLE